MGVLLRIGKQKAILRGAEWRCALAPLEAELNAFTKTWVQREARSEELTGDLEAAISRAVVGRYQGKILMRTQPRAEQTQRRYFHLRQLDLFDR